MTEGLAEEAKAERGHRGIAPISLKTVEKKSYFEFNLFSSPQFSGDLMTDLIQLLLYIL